MVILNFKQLSNVTFPVFLLPSDNVEVVDGLVFVDNMIVDDRNVAQEKLGLRRLITPFKDLLPLRRAISDPVGLAKNVGNKTYIDVLGKIFTYEKTLNGIVKYHKIERIEGKESASTIKLKGISSSFIVARPPPLEQRWAGVLYLHGFPWKLYEFSECKLSNTRRKI